ncbi:MAG: class I SAM-dependent methyltransferase [Acidimicrobiia bacterium]|nr:class I SAM-dependent methyltransferase [Acidimicrobiia bacterium]
MDDKPWSGFKSWVYSLVFRTPKTNKLVVEHAGLTDSDRTLDIGCGPGAAVRMAAEVAAEAVGVDRAQPMVDIARKRSRKHANARFEVGSAESLPFPDGSFTVVWSAHSYHHWEDPTAGLTEVRRVLAASGRVHILEQDGKAHGLNDAQAEQVVAELEGLGFGEVAVAKLDKQVIVSGTAP